MYDQLSNTLSEYSGKKPAAVRHPPVAPTPHEGIFGRRASDPQLACPVCLLRIEARLARWQQQHSEQARSGALDSAPVRNAVITMRPEPAVTPASSSSREQIVHLRRCWLQAPGSQAGLPQSYPAQEQNPLRQESCPRPGRRGWHLPGSARPEAPGGGSAHQLRLAAHGALQRLFLSCTCRQLCSAGSGCALAQSARCAHSSPPC